MPRNKTSGEDGRTVADRISPDAVTRLDQLRAELAAREKAGGVDDETWDRAARAFDEKFTPGADCP